MKADLGNEMRLMGLRKENARAWAEVERLRATLRDIIGLDHHNHGPKSEATKIARAALTTTNEEK